MNLNCCQNNLAHQFKSFAPVKVKYNICNDSTSYSIAKVSDYICDVDKLSFEMNHVREEYQQFESEYYKNSKFLKVKLICIIIERVEAFKTSISSKNKENVKKSILHSFFTLQPQKCTSLQSSEEVKGQLEDIKASQKLKLRKVLNQSIQEYISISFKFRKCLNKCINLFYFYRVGDPRNALLNHDFGLSKYAKYKCYLSIKLNSPNEINKNKNKHLFSVFSCKEDYDLYNKCRTFYFCLQNLPESELPKEIITKIIILAVKCILFKLEFIVNYEEIFESNIDQFIESKVQQIFETPLFHDNPEYYRSNGTQIFLNKFKECSVHQRILMFCVDYLEKAKEYKIAVCALLCLISTQVKISQRDLWFHRCALDLKHLKMIGLSFCICHKALNDICKEEQLIDCVFSHSK